MKDVVVVGAGVSGLSVAYRLKKAGYEVEVFEKEGESGGTVKTVKDRGYLYELGPQTLMADEKVLNFLKELALEPVEASPSSRYRFVYREGKLHPLPLSPPAFLTTGLLSLKGKLEALKDLFQRPILQEVSVAEFTRRHFGEEVLNYLVSPFLSGVWAGDPEKLSLVYATPKLYALQKKYGSLLKALLKERRFAPKGKLLSFKEGLAELVKRLKEEVPVKEGKGVLRIRRFKDRFAVEVMGKRVETKAVVLASPAYAASYLLRELSFSASKELEKVYYPPLAVVALAVEGKVPEGFGFLVPRVEKKRILGVLFSSKLFPGRAPEGKELLTVFIGGATDPQVAQLSEEEIASLAVKEVKEILPLKEAEPLRTYLWKKSIPQYDLGYGEVLELAKSLEEEFPGLFFAGNWVGGVSMGDAIRFSEKVAEKVKAFLG